MGKSSKSKSAQSFGGYQSFNLNETVPEEYKKRAQELAENSKLMRAKLKQKPFVSACKRKGIDIDETLPRVIADFRTDVTVSQYEAQARYKAFEARRRRLIGIALREADNHEKVEEKRKQKLAEREKLLQQLLNVRLEKERRNIATAQKRRKKYESAVHDENIRLLHQRTVAGKGMGAFHTRTKQIDLMKKRAKLDLQIKARKKQERRKKLLEKREAAEKKYKEMQIAKLKARDERIAKWQAAKEKKRLAAVNRGQGSSEPPPPTRGAEIDWERRAELERRMKLKQDHIANIRRKKERERENQRIQRNLRMEERMANAARMRKALEFQAQEKAEQLAAEHARAERMKQINKAIEAQRRSMMREEKIKRDQWKNNLTLEREVTPGPGHYTLPDLATQVPGGTWSRTRVKSEFEEIEYHGRNIPGPGKYGILKSSLNPAGGCIARRVPSQMDMMLKKAGETPGPGHYQPREIMSNNPQAFAKFSAPGYLDQAIRNGRDVPGPGKYSGTKGKVKDTIRLRQTTRKIVSTALNARPENRRRPQTAAT
eukprot:g3248.t1